MLILSSMELLLEKGLNEPKVTPCSCRATLGLVALSSEIQLHCGTALYSEQCLDLAVQTG